jgi:hypothetical protein
LSCAVLLAIVVREGMQYFAEQRDQSVRADYAKIADRPEQLPAFAAKNSDHPLAGVAYLRAADARYAAGDFRAAGENYNKAVGALKNSALLGRARLGVAMSQISGGDKAAGETTLKALSTDASLSKSTRAEAFYHLATIAHEAGNTTELSRLVAEIGKLDGNSVWAQRATAMLAGK